MPDTPGRLPEGLPGVDLDEYLRFPDGDHPALKGIENKVFKDLDAFDQDQRELDERLGIY